MRVFQQAVMNRRLAVSALHEGFSDKALGQDVERLGHQGAEAGTARRAISRSWGERREGTGEYAAPAGLSISPFDRFPMLKAC